MLTNHVGVYYIALFNRFNQAAPFSISVTFTAHTVLALNQTFVSDAPLLGGQVRYFEYRQPGLTTSTVEVVLEIADPTQFGAVYLNTWGMSTPASPNYDGYPSPTQYSTWSMVGDLNHTGLLFSPFTYQCTSLYLCVWQISLYAPIGQNLLEYTFTVGRSQHHPSRHSSPHR